MTVKQVLKLLKDDGWYIARQKGSHRQLKHPTKKGLITVAGNMSDELKRGTLGSVLRKAGLK